MHRKTVLPPGTPEDVLKYLQGCDLICAEDVVARGVKVVDNSRRNLNFTVTVGERSGFLVKVARDKATRATLSVEAHAYAAIREAPAYERARDHVPDYFGWDDELGVLVLELVCDRVSARAALHHADLAERMGRTLGSIHAAGLPLADSTGAAPWPLYLAWPSAESFRELSPAHFQLTRLLQAHQLLHDGLFELATSWTGETWIHTDVKWDNWVYRPPDEEDGEERLVLVDWEMMTCGESAWDVGSMFAEILSEWIEAIRLPPGTSPSRFAEIVEKPLEGLQPTTCAFWSGYCAERGWIGLASTEPLLKAVQMTAGRLVQRVYEAHVDAHELSGNGTATIDLARRVLGDPHAAAVHILGLDLQGPET